MEKKYFGKNIENELIILSHIKQTKIDEEISFKRYLSQIEPNDKNIQEKNLSKEIEKYKKNNSKYYKINNQDMKELESSFKSPKLKVYVNNPIEIGDGKIFAQNYKNYIIYDNTKYNVLYNFEKVNDNDDIYSGIFLDKTDIILSSDYKIFIYRFSDEKFSLFQTINEYDLYKPKYFQGYEFWEYINLKYNLIKIKKLDEKSFISISTYGFKIFNKDNNNNYSCTFTYICDETNKRKILIDAYEINKNEYIAINKRIYEKTEGNFTYELNEFVIEIVEIKDCENNKGIGKDESNKSEGFFSKFGKFLKDLIYKTNYNKKEIFNFIGYEHLSNYLILKKKFFIILIENNLLILNLLDKHMKMYFITRGIILKWNCNDDNKFLLIDYGNIILLELKDNEENPMDINLIITGYLNSPYINNLIKIKEKNSFYKKFKNYILVY